MNEPNVVVAGIPWDAGITFEQYMALMRREAEHLLDLTRDEPEQHHLAFAEINLQRTVRILRTYTPSAELQEVLEAMREPQYWMVLTEPWCGDSAQAIPYLATIAAMNPRIVFRLFRRDTHPAIMDRYLTNGARSIPKLVAFGADGKELFQWGPRPMEAQHLVQKAISEGLTKEQWLERLHLWYGRNRGEDLEAEIVRLVRQTID